MICAYDKVYLNMAQRVMGNMLNYAVYDCGYELSEYYNIFLESSYCERFGKGDIFVIAGMSGAELAIKVLDIPDDKIIMPGVYDGRSQEYWLDISILSVVYRKVFQDNSERSYY